MKGIRIRGQSIQLDFYFRGMRCRETLKLEPNKRNIAHAKGLLATILHEIAMGTFNYSKHFPDSPRALAFDGRKLARATVQEALEAYMASKKPLLQYSTCKDYEASIARHLVPAFGHVPIKDLSARMVREWMAGLPLSAKRVNNIMVPLRGMMKEAFMDGLIEKNPLERIRNLPVHTEEPDPFSYSEIRLILNACQQPQHQNLFLFAFWTGLRTSELIALAWEDIDWHKEAVHVRKAKVRERLKTTKTRAGTREVLLLPTAIEALKAQKAHTWMQQAAVFHNPRQNAPWKNDHAIRQAWASILRRAGIRYRNPYQTRHTYASMLLTAGENPMWVAAQMGHADWGMIRKVYGRWIPANDPLAGSRVAKTCDQFVTKPSPNKPISA
jgi:integrase